MPSRAAKLGLALPADEAEAIPPRQRRREARSRCEAADAQSHPSAPDLVSSCAANDRSDHLATPEVEERTSSPRFDDGQSSGSRRETTLQDLDAPPSCQSAVSYGTSARQVRAVYSQRTIRVYQAYNSEIAEAAVQSQCFVHPWQATRMTWIKPSAAWMGYRCGWSHKDRDQARVLAVDLHREAFDLLLSEAQLASRQRGRCDVVVQWDPERGLGGHGGKSAWTHALGIRSLQMGIRGEMTRRFASKAFVAAITDVTSVFKEVGDRLRIGDVEGAAALLPVEKVYPLPAGLAILRCAQYPSEQDTSEDQARSSDPQLPEA